MAFGTATVVTTIGKAIAAKRHIGATPAQLEPLYVGIGVGATGAARTAVVGDVALSTAVESRVAGTPSNVTVTTANDTFQVVGTVTATASRAVDEAGTFDAAAAGQMDISATFPVVNLLDGDSLQLTFKKTFA
jgi:hypothetical protein